MNNSKELFETVMETQQKAMNSFVETAKYGITVNNICPGFIGTEMVGAMPEEVLKGIVAKIPVGKLGDPKDIAEGVVYLVNAPYMTGQCLNINGGLYM